MTKPVESNGFRKAAAGHLRKARTAKNPDEKELQADLAKGYKALAESDALLENERGKTAGKEKKKPRAK
jgi:hypothetical protein